MFNLVLKILKFLTSWYLRKKKPKIIAITGSVGKTTTKKAITQIVERRYETRAFEENSYNTEIGLPLFILGQKVPTSKLMWPIVILRGIFEIFFGKDYEVLVVEMGADKPGDLGYLTKLVHPDIAVVTRVTASHLEEFRTVKNVLKEKEKIVKALDENGIAILNNDDSMVMSMKDHAHGRVITYGLSEDSDIYCSDIKIAFSGTKFKLHIKEYVSDMEIKTIGEHLLYSVMAGVSVGVALDYSPEEISEALNGFDSVRGRLKVLEGINESFIIDDSYNSNPVSATNSLKTLDKIEAIRKIAVLGTMNEMGDYFEKAHQEVGAMIPGAVDILVTVGDGGKIIAETAFRKGLPRKNIHKMENSEDAGIFLRDLVKKGDVVLFKGSQNKVRLEKAIKFILKNPGDAPNLLVRQGEVWFKK